MIHLTPSQADAEFYRLVHTLLQARANKEGVERRAHGRTPMWARQRIAPIWGERIPAKEDFEEVICLDLSGSGFGFLHPEPPRYRFLVAEFGLPPHGVYVMAEVIHYRPVLLWSCGAIEPLPEGMSYTKAERRFRDRDPRDELSDPCLMVQIGCRFVRRIDPTELP
jgi:hypothetical protein